MSKPPIDPKKTVAGIAVDPRTLERVIPQSRRADGSVRKEMKIRPGYTPQEDIQRFRGTRQAQMDSTALPKGHIVGWVPPTSATATSTKPMSKSAKKNAKRKEKRDEKKDTDNDVVKDNWDDDDDDEQHQGQGEGTKEEQKVVKDKPDHADNTLAKPPTTESAGGPTDQTHTADKPNWAAAPDPLKPPASAPAPKAAPTQAPRAPRGPPDNRGVVSKLAAELKKLDVKQ